MSANLNAASSPFWKGEEALRVATPTALAGCYLFAFLSPFSTVGSNFAMALVLFASLLAFPRFWQDVRREPVFWWSLALTGYVLIRSLVALESQPILAEAKNPHWTHLLRVTGLIALPFGWWLYRYPRHIAPILSTALVGLLVGVLYEGQLDWMLEAQFNRRTVWGYNPNYLALMSGAAVMALLAWRLSPSQNDSTNRSWAIVTPLLAILLFFIYTSQSRAVWLALPAGLLILFGFVALSAGAHRWFRLGTTFFGLILATTAAIVIFDDGKVLQSRLTQEWYLVTMFLNGELEAVAVAGGPVGERVEMWLAGLEAFSEKPWFGWGPGSGILVLRGKFADLPYSHFHNLYMELLVGTGLFGVALIIATAYGFITAAVRATRQSLWSPAMAAGLFAVTGLAGISLFFAIRIGQTEGRAALTLFTALYAVAVFRAGAQRAARETIKLSKFGGLDKI